MKITAPIFRRTMEELLNQKIKSISDNTSSYSDLLLWKYHPDTLKRARDVKLLIVVMSFIGLNPIQEEDFRNKMMKIAHKRKFEGEWNEVRLLLLIKFTPLKVLSAYLENRSSQDYFGNDLRRMKFIYRHLGVFNPYLPKVGPVKRPQWKRGYDDKGHLSTSSLKTEHFVRPAVDPPLVLQSESTLFFEDTPLKENNKTQETLVVTRTVLKESNRF